MDIFTYHVVGKHGQILDSKQVVVPSRNYHVFSIRSTIEFLPSVNVFVFIFNQNRLLLAKTEVKIESKNFKLNGFVDIQMPVNRSLPNHNVLMTIKSNPLSVVGLTGVDQSVLLLKENKDLTVETVVDDLKHSRTLSDDLDDFEDYDVLHVSFKRILCLASLKFITILLHCRT